MAKITSYILAIFSRKIESSKKDNILMQNSSFNTVYFKFFCIFAVTAKCLILLLSVIMYNNLAVLLSTLLFFLSFCIQWHYHTRSHTLYFLVAIFKSIPVSESQVYVSSLIFFALFIYLFIYFYYFFFILAKITLCILAIFSCKI